MGVVRVRTFYPADPVGIVPGGVDTFIRGIIKWAPEDIAFSLIGMTTDAVARPPGKWSRCRLGQREFDFFPAIQIEDAGKRSRFPLSLRYTFSMMMAPKSVRDGFDIFEFHRIEPGLLFRGDPRPKNAFFHQDMAVIRSPDADILWRRSPGLYFALERSVVAGVSSAWCVREQGVAALRSRYPSQAAAIRFVPTWVDPEVFSPLDDLKRVERRRHLAGKFDLDISSSWIVSVGRLDTQKDPGLLLSAFAKLVADKNRRLQLLLIGDGILRPSLEKRAMSDGLGSKVRFLGLQSPSEIAGLMAAADVFALASSYEGMPMAVLEALGSGLPVATTDVGEVRKVVMPGVNGAISVDRSLEAFSACLREVLDHCGSYRGQPSVNAIQPFRPGIVLSAVYDNYRALYARSHESKGR